MVCEEMVCEEMVWEEMVWEEMVWEEMVWEEMVCQRNFGKPRPKASTSFANGKLCRFFSLFWLAPGSPM